MGAEVGLAPAARRREARMRRERSSPTPFVQVNTDAMISSAPDRQAAFVSGARTSWISCENITERTRRDCHYRGAISAYYRAAGASCGVTRNGGSPGEIHRTCRHRDHRDRPGAGPPGGSGAGEPDAAGRGPEPAWHLGEHGSGDSDARDIVVAAKARGIIVDAFASCTPKSCEWGKIPGTIVGADVNSVTGHSFEATGISVSCRMSYWRSLPPIIHTLNRKAGHGYPAAHWVKPVPSQRGTQKSTSPRAGSGK